MATHARPSKPSKRTLPAHARSSKPAPLTKSSASTKGGPRSAHTKAEEVEDEEVMATSFLQYCCRKKDNEKQLSCTLDYSPPTTPFANFSFDEVTFRDIVPPRSPTAARSQRSSCAFSDLSCDDNAESGDEKLEEDSEASRYLRQFQSASTAAETSVRPTRPRLNRASTSQATYSAAPSLSHTPASSISFSLPYTPSTRPLPPRTNPHSSWYGSRSIDLVTPFTIASTVPSSPSPYSLKSSAVSKTSSGTVEGEILYQKSPIPSASPANGSLRRLFASSSRRS